MCRIQRNRCIRIHRSSRILLDRSTGTNRVHGSNRVLLDRSTGANRVHGSRGVLLNRSTRANRVHGSNRILLDRSLGIDRRLRAIIVGKAREGIDRRGNVIGRFSTTQFAIDVAYIFADGHQQHDKFIAEAQEHIAQNDNCKTAQEVLTEIAKSHKDVDEAHQHQPDSQYDVDNTQDGFQKQLTEIQEFIHPTQKSGKFSIVAST